MALHFDVTEVKDFKAVTTYTQAAGNEIWHPVTDALIWASIYIGFSAITEKNADEISERLMMWQKATSPLLVSTNGPIWITPADVHQHIGLRTNATPLTKAAFNKKLLRVLKEVSAREHNKDGVSARALVGDADASD